MLVSVKCVPSYCQVAAHYVHVPQFTHSPDDGYLDCLQTWAIMRKAAVTPVDVWHE